MVTSKILAERGVRFDCFELGSDIGGNWRYENDNQRSAVYASLHIDTSKDRMAFSDFPMPRHWPPYLHHSQVLEYFERYAAKFELKDLITFRHEVVSVEGRGDAWTVAVRALDEGPAIERSYRAVVVANGHHWSENRPDFPGEFTGKELHSHAYRVPDKFHGRRVVVVGIGNSAADISCELSWHAAAVTLSTRRSAHIVPRYLFGQPADKFTSPMVSRLPIGLQRKAYRALIRLARGRQSRYGLPPPDHELLEAHPTLSQDLLQLVRSGEIVVKPNIERLDGQTIWFEDGSSIDADVVIYATGYRVDFPFIPMEVLVAKDNVLPLYRKVVHPDLHGLYFVGLIQPLGATMPLAEQQAEWVSRLIEGAPLPSPHDMARSIEEDQRELEARYVPSKRHTLQVDFFPYKQLMMAEVTEAENALAAGEVSHSAEEVDG